MKILMTTDTVGGVWTYCLQLTRALAEYDCEVYLAAKGAPSVAQVAAADAIDNLHLFWADFKLEWMENPWRDVAGGTSWLLSLFEWIRPDLVHLNDYCHGAAPWRAPVLMVGHSCVLSWIAAVRQVEDDRGWERYREEVTSGLQAADRVVAPTAHMLSALQYFYGPLPPTRVIHNGCDPPTTRVHQKHPHVFSAGRLWDEAKGLKTLAAAAPGLDWPVRVAGLPRPGSRPRGPKRAGGVRWLGRLSTEEMSAEYSRAAIYALPALYEPFGLTPLEAALHDCALVLGDVPTLREVWGDAACFVDPRKPWQLAEAVNALAASEERRRDYAARARRVAHRLTARRMAESYYGLYSHMLVRHAGTAKA